MKKIYLLFFLLIFINCSSLNNKNKKQEKCSEIYSTDLISLTVPTIYNDDIYYLNSNDLICKVDVDTIPHDSTLLGSLSKIDSSVSIYKKNESGSISFIGNSASLEKGTYIVIYDYIQSQAFVPNDGSDQAKKIIGICVRMTAEVTSEKNGIDLSDIFKIGINSKSEKVSGSLSVKSIGINSRKINQIIPVTSDLSPASISTALQAVATIKSHIYDSETKITPYFLGFAASLSTNDASIESIINKMSL